MLDPKRREFITLVGGGGLLLAAKVKRARAQQSAMPVIGVLHGVSAAQWTNRMAGFHRGLGEAGFAEGRNVAIEYRWAEGQFDRLPAMAADLVSRKVAVISAGAPDVALRAAMAATKTIPIVFVTASDPVHAGFVSSLGRPQGNVTGVTLIGVELSAKRLELLHEVVPGVARIAVLVNPCKIPSGSRRPPCVVSGWRCWSSRPEAKARSKALLPLRCGSRPTQ
jgi:putative ABC transport system substrate-binding protein